MAKLAGKWLKVYVDDNTGTPVARDVSSDVDSVDIPDEYGSLDMTGFSDGSVNSAPGMPNLPIKITGKFDPAATTGLYTVLKGILGAGSAHTVTVQVGQNAAPTTGDPEFEGEFWLQSMPVGATPTGNLTIAGNFEVFGASAPAWGTVS